MPCYLFTYHAYRSWLPDRPQGFVQKGQGVQPPNPQLARAYRDAAKQAPVEFDRAVQRVLIEKMMDICQTESLRQHAASAEPTHVHVLVSWPADRPGVVADARPYSEPAESASVAASERHRRAVVLSWGES